MRGQLIERVWESDPTLYAPPRFRRACRYMAFLPDLLRDYDDELTLELATTLADADAAVRQLNVRAQPALAPLSRLLLRTESIASSKVEGLQVDARDLARAEARAESGGGPPGPLAAEILANIDAMELAIDELASSHKITTDGICAVHETLMERVVRPGRVGAPRQVQNWIGGNDYNPCGANFVPPPPERVPALLEDLVDFASEEHLPALLQAAIAHAQFETIHPFEDGNGRTGRALIHVVLRRRGVAPSYVPPISVVLAGSRDAYIDSLEHFRAGDSRPWLEQFAVATARAARLAEKYIDDVDALAHRWRERLAMTAAPRADAAAWAVIEVLKGYPIITVPVATAASGRGKSAVAVAINQLADAGVLLPLSDSARNRAWEVEGLLDAIVDLDAG